MEIVMLIAEEVAKPIIGYIVAPITRQVSYLIFYKDNFKNLKDQYTELKRVKGTISHEVEVERKNGRKIYDAVQNWLNRVDEIVKEAEQLSNDPRHRNVACCKGPFPNFKSRHQLSRKAKKMAGHVAEVMKQKDNIRPLAFLPDLEGVGSTSATSSEKLESRKKMKEDIVLALRDTHISRVGVYGLSGVGKSTLVKEIAKQVEDDKLFDKVVMANISQVADLKRIQCEIADFLGLRFEEMTIIGRAARLRQRIKNEGSILVILDDIWEILELDKLGLPSNDHKGCKLLLISRKLDILQNMESQKDFLIDILNEEEAWTLFKDMVGDVVKDANLRNVAIQVAQKCAGLIVLIVIVARALKNKDDIDSWKDALNQLKTVDEEGLSGKIYSALEFSYNHLDGDEVKALFLLCGSIGPQIHVEYLLKCVMGLGIFKHINTLNKARLKLHRLIGSLKASCLLLGDNSNMKVEMHDIVHEVAVSIASRDQHVFKIGTGGELKKRPSEDFLQRCTQIILRWCDIPKLPESLECPNIKLFYLYNKKNESLSVPDSFFAGMKNLKVLDLTCMHLPSLPQSFRSLIDLQTLCLDQCALGDMTNIGALRNLQILCLYSSSMIRLPSELGQLIHLRMLDLTNSGIEIFPSNIISKLTKLEELYLGNTSIKWEQEDSDEENKNASLSELRHLTNLTALEIQIKGAWVLPNDIMFDKLERYKIVIGDVWEWSDNYGASKMLKLKLSTVTHLEHGIKEVEDLYLDEVHGISNVLNDLNGEGFPLLKHLHIQNNGKIQHIINPKERIPSHVFFPKLETLMLQNLNILETIYDGSFMNNSFARLRAVKVKCCDELKYLFSVPMVKALCQLIEIEVLECRSIKNIVFVENSFPNSVAVDENIEFGSLQSLTLGYLPAIDDFYSGLLESSTTAMQSLSLDNNVPSSFINSKVKFSNLETLNLSSINLENIWQDDHVFIANSFHKLANLSVEGCSCLKYLFSSSIVGSFPNLKQLEIRECEMMEEIISTEGRNGAATDKVGLPNLETLVISNMKRLNKAWHSQFDGLKTMEVNNCGKLTNIFPYDVQGTFGSLETLKVSKCGSVEEIFQLTSNEIHIEEKATTQDSQLKKLHLLHLPELKQIWSTDANQANIDFHDLQLVCVECCENLGYLLPFSIAMQAAQLKDITIKWASNMKQIVSDKEGPIDSPVKFKFNNLMSLVLWRLYELEGLFARNHRVICPLLRKLDIRFCWKLKLFKTQSTSGREIVFGGKLQIPIKQHLFPLEEVICNLEMLALNSEDASMILQGQFLGEHFSKLKCLFLSDFEGDDATFPYWFLQNITTLTELLVEWSSFREIFQEEIPIDAKGKFKTGTQIKTLALYQLQDLQHICKEGFQIDQILEDLEYLYVYQCSNLKDLVPSSVTFNHLTYVEVGNCHGLIHLITSSTARSLGRLTTMKISKCNSLEKVVAEEEGSEDEIAFNSLEILELECLPKIKRFCSCNCFLNLPLLKEVVVNKCPRMDSFSGKDTSTPKLQKISSKEDGKVYWEGDINMTIKKLFADMVMFSSFNHLEFSEYPELKEIWYSQVGQKIFCNLKHLVVCKCIFLSNTLFSSILLQLLYTLEELEVAECDSLEAVFDVKALSDTTMESKRVSGLKKLTLSGLPNLKHIWNKEAGEIISFGNLQIVKVDECPNLKYVFSPSLCQELRQLEELDIESCGVDKIVANEEGLEELKFHFPLLRILRLINLRQLNDFYQKKYTLECPSLKTLRISRCESLQIFAFEHLDSYQLKGGCGDLPIQQALFHIEKVSENLEDISLTEKDAMRILNGNYERKLFQRTEILRLQYFQKTPIKFLNDLIQKFPATTTLHSRYSYFKILFPPEEIGHCSIQSPPQIKTLWLFLLEKLEHIWNDNSSLDTFVPNLEHLGIYECCRLIRLAPPLTSFTNLITLRVLDCNGMMDFMSPSTAKSLVHLTHMTVGNCRMLEEVVMSNEGGPEEQIIFKSLKYLELTCLPRFKSFCFGKHTFIFPSLVTLKVIGCHKMRTFSSGITVAPFLKLVEVENGKKHRKGDLNTTITHLFLEKTNENLNMDTTEASSSKEQVGESKPNQIADIGKQEIHKLPSESYDTQQNKQASSNQDTEDSQDLKTPFSKNLSKEATTVNNKESFTKGTQKMGENIERPLVDAAKIALSPRGIYDAEVNETIEKPLIQTSQYAQRPAARQDIEESHGSKACPNEDSFNHPKTFVNRDKKKDIHDAMDKPLIQTDQDAEKFATIQNTEESRDSYTGTQKICNTIKKASISAAQDVSNSTMIPEAVIDPSPSHAPEPVISPTEKLNIYRNYKGMIDIPKQNMPYLKAGVNRHPQVLDWFNTNRRRVFASSTFSLFAEVTCILRTTQKGHLTEDDRSYIRECCTVLEAAGFDVSWLSYVQKCIEECGDAEDIKRKFEETKGQASSLEAQIESMKKELASVKESLVLLLDKARNVDDFIES